MSLSAALLVLVAILLVLRVAAECFNEEDE